MITRYCGREQLHFPRKDKITEYTVQTSVGPVLVTDDPKRAETAKLPVVGVGLDFRGNAALVVEDADDLTPELLEKTARRALHLPVTIAVTKRLILREMTEEETGLLDALDEAVASRFTGPNEYHGLTRAEIHDKFAAYRKWAYEMLEMGLYLVFRRSDGRLIGRVGFSTGDFDGTPVMLSYEIVREERRKGFASEAVSALLDYARGMGIGELCILTSPENAASRAIALRSGFLPCGFRRGKEKFLLTFDQPD